MSYPLYLLSCCHGDSDGHLINSTLSRDHLIFTDDITNVFCIISSTLSLLGVFYLLLPRGNLDLTTPLTHTRILTGPSLKSTVLSLFAADCLAAAGETAIVKFCSIALKPDILLRCNTSLCEGHLHQRLLKVYFLISQPPWTLLNSWYEWSKAFRPASKSDFRKWS